MPPSLPFDPDKALREGRCAHEAGDLRQAEACYRRVLAAAPDHAEALNLLGTVALQVGRPGPAADLFRKSLAADQNNPDSHANLGAALIALEQVPAAMQALNRALALDPANANAHYSCGLVMLDAGDFEQAAKAFATVARLQPDRPDAAMKLGVALMQLGRADEGLRWLRRAAAIAPEDDSVGFNLAIALIRLGRLDEAEKRLDGLDEAFRRMPHALFARGQIHEARGDAARAEACFRGVLDTEPDNARAHFALGKQLMDLDRLDEAERHTRRALALGFSFPEARCNLGLILDNLGRHDEAAACFREAGETGLVCLAESHIGRGAFGPAAAVVDELAAADPDHPCLFPLRSQIAPERIGPAERRHAEAIAARGKGDPFDIADLLLALGRSYESDGAFDRAFDCFRRANALLADGARYDPEAEERWVGEMIACFPPALFDRPPGFGNDSDVPVFVVGMPRSGTTLVEQIVASHPRAAGAGELRDMSRFQDGLQQALGSGLPFPRCVSEMTGDVARRLAGAYLDRLAGTDPGAARIVDKMPHNFRCLGLIALLFPKARIVHCTRDALDTCFSIYQHRFTGAHGYAYGLDSLGHYYRQYERLMAHWAAVLPAPMHVVRYERLIAAPEAEVRALIAFLGLDWDRRCLAFHRTERTVRTASAWQVRQPLYGSAVGRSRRYEAHLDPLKNALAGR